MDNKNIFIEIALTILFLAVLSPAILQATDENLKDNSFLKGKDIFLKECSACHGIDGKGLEGVARNLTIWGSEDGVIDTIANGSKGLKYTIKEMPSNMASDKNLQAVAAYMAKDISSIKTTSNENLIAQGKESWGICASCHGDDGKGMGEIAPDLTLYGNFEFVVDVLNRGKEGHIGDMPSFKETLSDEEKIVVGKYVISLSKDD
ncbi:putative cytochrome c [Campylobacter blaseri]|uniref:Cytochrome c domain-containing protein n=1 Tax=Campylobacter blaseri TaxID=2042961 RepID=A0A2P8QZF9_9BACT|nr:c-type cytochrome [Campylobacter blaseri]PSM51638.1 hypothetical protein CQ405_07540 [Campylobacter blaseri]PSM53431.1 hypothetical protein CRN67_07545 [Campylobacter blaseri]QKF86728.1 putative cytochrome c [Campylobacter blaseri]